MLLAGFIAQESRAAHPLMPFSIFRLQTLTAANIVMFIMGTALFSMFLMLTLYMQQVLHFSPLKTGIGYLAVAGTAIIWANVAAPAVTRVGVKPTLVIGMSVMTVGLVLFTQVSADGSYWKNLFPGFLVIGFGMPLAFVSLTIAALAGTREHEAGLASGLINTSQQIGGAVGIAILSTDRDIDDERLRGVGHGRARGADERIPERVLGRSGDHPRRRDRVARPRSPARLRRRARRSSRPRRSSNRARGWTGQARPVHPPVRRESYPEAR